MSKPKNTPDFLLLLIILIGLLSLVLFFFQFNWINNSSKSTELRLKANLRSSFNQVLSSIRIETGLLYSSIYLTKEEAENEDYTRFKNSIREWKSNTFLPGLLDNIFLAIEDENEKKFLRWLPGKETFIQIPVPSAFSPLYEQMDEGNLNEFKEYDRGMRELGNFLISPARGEIPGNDRTGPPPELPPMLTLELDTNYLYSEVLGYYMEKYLSDYPFTLTRGDQREIIIEQGEIPKMVQPELTVPLDNSRFYPLEDPGQINLADEIAANIFARIWISIVNSQGNEPLLNHSEYYINIYYPGGNITQQIQNNKTMSLIVSSGFIVLFIATLIILYSLYRQSKALRIQERNFISSMTHELRTPLAVIRSTSDTLSKGIVKDPKRIYTYSKTIAQQAERLGNSVEGS